MHENKMTKTEVFGGGFAICAFVFIWWLFLSVVASTYIDNGGLCDKGKSMPLIKTDMFCEANKKKESPNDNQG